MIEAEDIEHCSDEESLDSMDGDEFERDESERAARRRARNLRRRKLCLDEDFEINGEGNAGQNNSDLNSSSDNPMDALEQEELSDLEENEAERAAKANLKKKQKDAQKKFKHRHRSQALHANIDQDDGNAEEEGDKNGAVGDNDQNGDTIYIDNLPNDPQ